MRIEILKENAADKEIPETSLSGVTAVILAGGLGTRLRTLIADKQKVIADVNGRPFLEYLLDQLRAAGVRKIVLCIGHLAEQVETHFGTNYRGVQITYSLERSLLGTGGAVRFAMPLIESETILMMNGDSYCEADLESFADWHFAHNSSASVLLTRMEDTKRYGRVNIDEEKKIVSFDEKGSVEGPGLINAGIYLINVAQIRGLALGRNISIERDIFPKWIGGAFYGYENAPGAFIDIGTPASYKEAQDLFSGGQ